MSLHLLCLLVELRPHYTRSCKYEDDEYEDSNDPRPDTPALVMMAVTMVILLRIHLRHAAPYYSRYKNRGFPESQGIRGKYGPTI